MMEKELSSHRFRNQSAAGQRAVGSCANYDVIKKFFLDNLFINVLRIMKYD